MDCKDARMQLRRRVAASLRSSSDRRARVAAIVLAAGTLGTPAFARQAAAESAPCPDAATTAAAVLASPLAPWKGAPLRVVVTSERAFDGELTLVGPDGAVAVRSSERHGGPPYFWRAEVAAPAAGKWQARLLQAGSGGGCAALAHDITVARARPTPPGQKAGTVWPIRDAWSHANESLYSAWIETLFDAPLDQAPSWKALHEVLRDPTRNLLFDHLGLREDQKGVVVKPDCADLPYFLRAYFAFKMGLPYGYAKCTRGGGGHPPRCPQWWNLVREEPPPPPPEAGDAQPGQPGGQPGGKSGSGGTPPAKVAAKSGGLFGALFGSDDEPPPARRDKAGKTRLPPARVATEPPPKPKGLVPAFAAYLETVGNGVHSGNGRTAAADEETDYYPVPLSEASLRPGTVYADPYGHLLVLAKRVAQSGSAAGILLAVDGQPDGTVARKRFWRGNFLFAQDPALGSPGFKRFRPVVREGGGGLRRLSNREIEKSQQYADFSLEQSKLSVEGFYDRMDDVVSPAPLDPERAMLEAVTALDEQVKARVTSVENGRKYQMKGGGDVGMPDGASIFETTGAWEDFATPSRDLRLLIAIDVVRGFPERVARRPERYAMPAGKSAADVKVALDALLATELAKRAFAYTRTDGSSWTLSLKDVVDRIANLEMAYNVNDCVELRWGAVDGGQEAATCKRRAPDAQKRRMADYRAWFHERRRPARGVQ